MSEFDTTMYTLNQSAESLKTLYFRPPGIFTNALVFKPDITTLLRDADAHESSLYKVDPNGVTERKDGSRGVIDALNEEFDQLEYQQMNDTLDTQDGLSTVTKPAVLFVPKGVESSLPEINRGVKNLLKRFNEENLSEYEFETLCSTVRQLLEKYPVNGMEEELQQYEQSFNELSEQILQNEQTLEKQKRLLSQMNTSVSDRRLSANKQSPHTHKKTVEDLIIEEEAEIQRLQVELEKESGEVATDTFGLS